MTTWSAGSRLSLASSPRARPLRGFRRTSSGSRTIWPLAVVSPRLSALWLSASPIPCAAPDPIRSPHRASSAPYVTSPVRWLLTRLSSILPAASVLCCSPSVPSKDPGATDRRRNPAAPCSRSFGQISQGAPMSTSPRGTPCATTAGRISKPTWSSVIRRSVNPTGDVRTCCSTRGGSSASLPGPKGNSPGCSTPTRIQRPAAVSSWFCPLPWPTARPAAGFAPSSCDEVPSLRSPPFRPARRPRTRYRCTSGICAARRPWETLPPVSA